MQAHLHPEAKAMIARRKVHVQQPVPPATDTEGRLAILVNQLDIHIPPHMHEDMDEFVYVLDGEMEIVFQRHRLTKDMCAFLPRGVQHAMRNAAQPPARALQMPSPGGCMRYSETTMHMLTPQSPWPALSVRTLTLQIPSQVSPNSISGHRRSGIG
jgi:mannose-6-phosphate isomerase-like protein (cupin superfamily)